MISESSASFIALNEAFDSMSKGEAGSALVIGVNLFAGHDGTNALEKPDAIKNNNQINGSSRGEAISAVYIKSLREALVDGNPIRGVIRAIHKDDVDTGGMPGVSLEEAPEELIRKTYEKAGLDPSRTAYFEV